MPFRAASVEVQSEHPADWSCERYCISARLSIRKLGSSSSVAAHGLHMPQQILSSCNDLYPRIAQHLLGKSFHILKTVGAKSQAYMQAVVYGVSCLTGLLVRFLNAAGAPPAAFRDKVKVK